MKMKKKMGTSKAKSRQGAGSRVRRGRASVAAGGGPGLGPALPSTKPRVVGQHMSPTSAVLKVEGARCWAVTHSS